MLESLSVRNYVLIDRLDLDLSSGFICLTGETGSGKSIILGALSLLLGAKADKEAVREGESEAQVTGTFHTENPKVLDWTKEHGIDTEDNLLVLRRTIKTNGRSSYVLNGSPITRTEGEELGQILVDVSSQHAHQTLMKSDVQRQMLDEASGSDDLLAQYRDAYGVWRKAKEELSDLRDSIEKGKEEKDYMEYCLSELEKAELKEGEEEELEEKLKLQSSSEFIAENLDSCQGELRSATAALAEALSYLKKADRKDPRLSTFVDRLESSSIETQDIYESIRDHLSSLTFNEAEIEMMNARLSTIQKIKRRFGGSVEAAIERREEYREKLELFTSGEEKVSALERKIQNLQKDVETKATKLTASRKKGAKALSASIEKNLHKLGMEAAVFHIEVMEDVLGPNGQDKISYLIAANKGEKTSTIENTSSGGELSRILLALKVSLKSRSENETMLFDEVDAGIGGVVAVSVADELRELSETTQVLCITHLPQIAAKADIHYLVSKHEEKGRTISTIRQIDAEARVNEIARLLSGDGSEISLEHARRLLEVNQ